MVSDPKFFQGKGEPKALGVIDNDWLEAKKVGRIFHPHPDQSVMFAVDDAMMVKAKKDICL